MRGFEIIDYTQKVVRDPEPFEATDMIRGIVETASGDCDSHCAYWAFPTYLWILRKPKGSEEARVKSKCHHYGFSHGIAGKKTHWCAKAHHTS